MSVASLELRCLVLNDNPELLSFIVRIEDNYFVSELKQVIKTKAAPHLNNVFAPTLLLWKCAIPMEQDIIEDIRLDGTDRRISRIAGDHRLSELWSGDLPPNTIHILAQAPAELLEPVADEADLPPRKRTRIDFDLSKNTGLRSTITPSGSNDSKLSVPSDGSGKPRLLHAGEVKREHQLMFLLYDVLWKKGKQAWTEISHIVKEHVPDPFITPRQAEETDPDPPEEDQITIVDLTSLLGWTAKDVKLDVLIPIVLVRDDYIQLDDFLGSHSEHVLLLGQPGIGKTVYLTYCLLRRLLAGLPTIFAKTGDIRYIFLDSGVHWIPSNSFRMSEDPLFTDQVDNTLVLFDLNEEQSTPERFLHWRILASSSPKSGRYREWSKHRGAEHWVMRTWSWEEIYFARKTATNNRSLKELFEAFRKYGGTARNLLTRSPKRVESEIGFAISNCTNFSSLFPASRDFREETSHALITIDPKVDDAGLLDRAEYDGQIATPYILNLLVISKNREFANGMKDTFRTFMLNPFTRSAPGVIFEGRGHLYLFSSLKSPLIIQPLSMDENPVSVKLQHAERIHFFKDLPTSFNNLNVNLYYQPLSPTTLGIDSFCLEVDDNGVATSVVFFQFTISENHPINPSFVSKLWKKGTRVRNQPKWKLVFIVPLEDVPTFRTQIWKSDGDIWSRRVSQYVVGVDVDELFIRPQ